ncbi:MAG TPA: PIG-L family deacetylase [Candidatus Baltobacteraceae bacterium]|nr:PIG-L family deacetylase [Candidatus Baltobacteraceae bacterium]
MIRRTKNFMNRFTTRSIATLLAVALLFAALLAPQTKRVFAQSLPDAVEAIDQARVATRILYTTAHPDDETAGLIAYLARGIDADVAMLQITRGQGGQNAIGPEQDGALGVIRTTELLAADQHYGAKQFFTRAVDTGFSKSAADTMKAWGDLPVEDMVRVIRTFRPDVVINGWGGVHFGHGQHQASGIYTPQAVADAADPTKFPEQIAEGLKPWKVRLELRPAGFAFGPAAAAPPKDAVTLPINDVSPLWGKSYVEMGMEGHAQHRSQGTPSFFGNPFFRRPTSLITENGQQAGGSFDPKLLAQPITSLADRFPAFQSAMAPALASVDQDLAAAAKSALDLDRGAAANSLAQAGKELAALREKVAGAGGEESAAALFELDDVRERIDAALTKDIALPIDTQADRHQLVAGENFGVTVSFLDQSAAPVKWTVDQSSLTAPAGWNVTLAPSKDGKTYQFNVAVPAGAKPPTSPGYAVLPFPPPLVTLNLSANVDGYDFKIRQPVESAVANTTGIDIYPLELVPAVTLTVEPRQVMVPAKKTAAGVALLARIRYHGTKPATVSVGLDAPAGWSVAPIAPLSFAEAGDKLIRYMATPPAKVALGPYPLDPYAKLDDETFRTSLEPIPTLPTRDWSESADATVHVLDLTVPAGLRVGYIAGDNDVVPESLRQIGIQVDMLDDVALAFGDLKQYDAIIVGIRAYELRPDVMAANPRLLDYVHDGGTLLVQYERDFAWAKLMPAPFKAEIPPQGIRVTNPASPVDLLEPQSPLLNSPNKITMADFEGWVQERGIYFWGTWGPEYHPVIGFTETGEPEAKGGLVYARDGKGLYIYTGISFFRELPAGVPGAYRLFVNLISQTRHSAAK